jgi:hypothetical protein
MEEDKDLVVIEGLDLAERESTEIDSFTRTSEFLPQIRIYGSEATIVKEGKFPMGHFGLYVSAASVIDLGEQFDYLAVDWRPRASIVSGESPISFFGRFKDGEWQFSKEFIEVKNRAMSKQQGHLSGLEFLLWLPAIEKFGLFLMGNPTLRRESPNVKALMLKPATLKVKLIKTTKFTWHGCTVFNCTTPFNAPDSAVTNAEVAKFRNPIDSEVEFDDSGSGSSRAR